MSSVHAARALMRLRAAIPKDEEVKEAFSAATALTPIQFAEACVKVKCTIHPDEIRAILDLFADKMLNIPSKVLVDAIIEAPPPVPKPERPTTASLLNPPPAAEEPKAPAAAPPPPPEPPAAGAPTATDAAWQEELPPPPTADRMTQRQWLTHQVKQAPYATFPETIAPQFPETTRSADAPLGARLTIPLHLKADYHAREVGYASGYLEETAAAFAARQANAAGKGAAGKPLIEKDVTAALAGRLTVPTTASEPPALTPRVLPPYGLDYHLDLLDISDEQENVGPAKVQTPRLTAPYPTLDPSQLAALEARDLEKRSRLGPSLWRPQTANTDKPAGLSIPYADAANDPLPRTMQWLDQPAGATRPMSRRGAGSARPQDTTSRIFG